MLRIFLLQLLLSSLLFSYDRYYSLSEAMEAYKAAYNKTHELKIESFVYGYSGGSIKVNYPSDDFFDIEWNYSRLEVNVYVKNSDTDVKLWWYYYVPVIGECPEGTIFDSDDGICKPDDAIPIPPPPTECYGDYTAYDLGLKGTATWSPAQNSCVLDDPVSLSCGDYTADVQSSMASSCSGEFTFTCTQDGDAAIVSTSCSTDNTTDAADTEGVPDDNSDPLIPPTDGTTDATDDATDTTADAGTESDAGTTADTSTTTDTGTTADASTTDNTADAADNTADDTKDDTADDTSGDECQTAYDIVALGCSGSVVGSCDENSISYECVEDTTPDSTADITDNTTTTDDTADTTDSTTTTDDTSDTTDNTTDSTLQDDPTSSGDGVVDDVTNSSTTTTADSTSTTTDAATGDSVDATGVIDSINSLSSLFTETIEVANEDTADLDAASSFVDSVTQEYSDFYDNVVSQMDDIDAQYSSAKSLFEGGHTFNGVSSGETPTFTATVFNREFSFNLCDSFSIFSPFVYFLTLGFFMIQTFFFTFNHFMRGFN